jgi:hypothetical protein
LKEEDIEKKFICVSKNNLGIASIAFKLTTKGIETSPIDTSRILSGNERPPTTDLESMCPAHSPCQDCSIIAK